MAYKDSDEIKANESYALGEYTFRIERSSVPGSTNDKIEAICTKDGKNARKSIQIPSRQNIGGWYVEANDTTADVYALIQIPIGDEEHESPSEWGTPEAVPSSSSIVAPIGIYGPPFQTLNFVTGLGYGTHGSNRLTMISVSASPYEAQGSQVYSYTYNGKTVYYSGVTYIGVPRIISGAIYTGSLPTNQAAWTIVYGIPVDPEYEVKEVLIGRFAIELDDAGGVGPGSDWNDPGDWNEDPTTTLQVTIEGALSGRHNDPLNDTSYSYIPADKDTVKDYGCGGDGGNGGGGGAGASSIVVYKFATDKANSKEIVCKPKRHGYGSGGGKGGKGGDGCILVYY